MINKRAFTLIELLVVIAIIAILAAILFPVFAQAKAAAKNSVGLSNMKQIGLSAQIYYNDYDDCREGRQMINSAQCESWKQVLSPYIKSQQIFHDPLNKASQFNDAFTDPAGRTAICGTVTAPLGTIPGFQRGYEYNNFFGQRSGGGYFDNAGLNLSSVNQVANVGDVVEGRAFTTDEGPFSQGWIDNVDSNTSWMAGNPTTGMIGSNLADKYNLKGQNVAYLDGHAKKTNYAAECTWLSNTGSDSTAPGTDPAPAWTGDPGAQNFWNFSENDINAAIPSTWAQFPNAVAQYCTSLPAANR
jgi:prepilin-type N-terminal cleavage/methylation domain-containing protein/prepilin-type processing-associated H-X9-DG protein